MKADKRRKEIEASDWLDQLVEEIHARKEVGELPSLAFLLESLLNEIMRRERDRFLHLNQGKQANGFYRRNLHLTLGKLSLKVPRVRYGKTFPPAILPPRWKQDISLFVGVHRVLVFVTDNFKGIHEVIEKLFPYACHQLCHLHLRRNLKRELSQEAYKEAGALLSKLRRADDQEEGRELFERLCGVVGREKPKLAGLLSAKAERYLAFLGYPEEVRKHIYTTNVVESVNAGNEQMRLELGGYFLLQRCLVVNLFIQVVNLEDWRKKPLPTVRGVSYKLQPRV